MSGFATRAGKKASGTLLITNHPSRTFSIRNSTVFFEWRHGASVYTIMSKGVLQQPCGWTRGVFTIQNELGDVIFLGFFNGAQRSSASVRRYETESLNSDDEQKPIGTPSPFEGDMAFRCDVDLYPGSPKHHWGKRWEGGRCQLNQPTNRSALLNKVPRKFPIARRGGWSYGVPGGSWWFTFNKYEDWGFCNVEYRAFDF